MRGRFARTAVARTARPRRPMDWYRGSVQGTVSSAAEVCGWLVLPQAVASLTDPTLMACIVSGSLNIASGSAAGDVVTLAAIAWNFTDPVTNAVPAPCPSPLTGTVDGQDEDWIWRLDYPLVAGVSGIFNFFGPVETGLRIRSRRRLGNDRAILLVAAVIGPTVDFHVHQRSLLKE